MKLLFPATLAFCMPLLAGCNTTSESVATAPAPAATNAARFPTVAMPEGSGCAAVIGRYDAVLKADFQTGNVNAKVYDQIQRELEGARNACTAGKDAEARSLVAASKARHGYPG
jgi:hypothetical protein